jgi:histidyl-tRNA synthetase
MKKADTSGARFAVIIGDDEAAAGELTLKPLRTPAGQVRLDVAQAVRRLRQTDITKT